MQNAFKVLVAVTVPRLCKQVSLAVRQDEHIGDLIYRVVSELKLRETQKYRLFGMGRGFTEIAPQEKCSILFSSFYDNLYLIEGAIKIVTAVYEDKCVKIAAGEFTPICHVIRLAIETMCLPYENDVMYVGYDPESDAILAMDCQVKCDFVVLKRLKMDDSKFLFSPSTFTGDDRVPIMRLPTLSKQLLAPPVKLLLSKVKTQRTAQLELAKLDSDRMKELLTSVVNGGELKDTTVGEQNALLFAMLMQKKEQFIPVKLHQMIVRAMAKQSDVEIFRQVQLAIDLLPLHTHIVVLELCQCFTSQNLAMHKNILEQLLTKILFKNSMDQAAELKFVSFLTVFTPWLLKFPARPSRKLRVHGHKLIIFDNDNPFDLQGPVNVALSDTQELVHIPDKDLIVEAITRDQSRMEMFRRDRIADLNTEIEDFDVMRERKISVLQKIDELFERKKRQAKRSAEERMGRVTPDAW